MKTITIPLINPNEPEALLAALHVQEGERIHQGDLVCTLETTKSTSEVTAESDGYIVGLRLTVGAPARAGDVLCYLANSLAEPMPADLPAATNAGNMDSALPAGLRITQPALALARQSHIELDQLPTGNLITEKIIREMVERTNRPGLPVPEGPFQPNTIILYGGGGHAKIVIDLLRALRHYAILGIIDDGRSVNESVMGVPVLGGAKVLPDLYERGVRLAVNCVGGIGNVGVRARVFEVIARAGFGCPSIIHPTALVEPGATVASGAHILARAYIGSEARVGFGCIVSTAAIVSHDCVLGDYANISPGAILAGEVQVGAGVLVGMGATINLRTRLGDGARIGNGATVKSDVPANGIVQAGSTWPND